MKAAKVNQDALRREQKRPVSVSANPGRGRSNWVASPASLAFRLSKCAARQGSRPPPPTAPDPTGLTCLSLGKKGGAWRVAAGTRGLGGCRAPPLLITPPRQSSSAPGVPTPRTPGQGKRPAATPGSLHFASALQRGRRSASTRGRWPGRAGYTASGPGGGDPDGGTAGLNSLAPNRFLPADLGPTGWLLVANVI